MLNMSLPPGHCCYHHRVTFLNNTLFSTTISPPAQELYLLPPHPLHHHSHSTIITLPPLTFHFHNHSTVVVYLVTRRNFPCHEILVQIMRAGECKDPSPSMGIYNKVAVLCDREIIKQSTVVTYKNICTAWRMSPKIERQTNAQTRRYMLTYLLRYNDEKYISPVYSTKHCRWLIPFTHINLQALFLSVQ